VTLYNPDDFCRTCRGKGHYREPSAHSYTGWTSAPCDACNGTGWRPGAQLDPNTMEAVK